MKGISSVLCITVAGWRRSVRACYYLCESGDQAKDSVVNMSWDTPRRHQWNADTRSYVSLIRVEKLNLEAVQYRRP